MANRCVNLGHPEFKELLSQSQLDPISLAADISIWQDKNNSDLFPTLDQLTPETLFQTESNEEGYTESKEVEENIRALELKLITGFLTDFDIDINEYESLKEDIGLDAVSASDIITKTIAYQKGESILPEVAYFAYSMLGKNNNKLRSSLKYLINKWDKYKERFEYHKNSVRINEGFVKDKKQWRDKVRDLVVLDFLQEMLYKHYTSPASFKKELDTRWTSEDFTLWSKIIRFIENFLSKLTNAYSSKKKKLENVGLSIADEVLNGNYEYFNYELAEDQIQKYYKTNYQKIY